MKKAYHVPELEIIKFTLKDAILTSGTSSMGNEEGGNGGDQGVIDDSSLVDDGIG